MQLVPDNGTNSCSLDDYVPLVYSRDILVFQKLDMHVNHFALHPLYFNIKSQEQLNKYALVISWDILTMLQFY